MYRNKAYLEVIIAELEAMNYIVEYKLLHTVQYGVPQNRERMFVVGHRGHFAFPPPQTEKVTAGDAVGDLIQIQPDDAKFLTPSMDRYVTKYEKASHCITPRDLHLGVCADRGLRWHLQLQGRRPKTGFAQPGRTPIQRLQHQAIGHFSAHPPRARRLAIDGDKRDALPAPLCHHAHQLQARHGRRLGC